MILYHGTTSIFEIIDLTKSAVGKDFGCGFYLSDNKEQAMEMANFKAFLLSVKPIVLTYEFDEKCLKDGTLKSLYFKEYSKEWAEFILKNRQNKTRENVHEYDFIYGPIANDRVGAQIRNLVEGNIDMDTFLKRLKYIKGITYQYYFGTEKAIKNLTKI